MPRLTIPKKRLQNFPCQTFVVVAFSPSPSPPLAVSFACRRLSRVAVSHSRVSPRRLSSAMSNSRGGQTAQQSNFVGETVDAKGIEVQRRFTAFLNE